MIKRILVVGLLLIVAAAAFTQEDNGFAVTGDLTTIYTIGNASEEDQAIGSGKGNGAYEEQRNGFYTNANIYVWYKPVEFLEGYVKLASTHRPGSLYMPLQLEYYGQSDFSPALDTIYGKAGIFKALGLALPVELNLKAGKYKTEASYFGKVSRYETESVLYMLKTATTYNYEIEAVYKSTVNDAPFQVTGAFTTNYRFDEATARLYDLDGSVSDHGSPVVSEYAPQIYGSLKLHEFAAGPGNLQGEVLYALNGADIYSGNSAGADFRYTLKINDAFSVPVGLGVGYYEKNIDVLSGTASTLSDRRTTDFRDTLALGLGAGARYNADPIAIDGNLGFSFHSIEHIYREPLTLLSASLDVQCTLSNRYFLGGGVILGSLGEAEWKTKDGVSEKTNGGKVFERTFSLVENIGYEVYAGLKLFKNSRFVIGFNQNKGIAMNRSLESKEEGQIKYKQKGTDGTDEKYEVSGLYFKFILYW
ncbi:MAG: hypothetical protein LBQ14_11585 [Treponema sp.]|jgi:hypothetical protein|nr:hypothetical protein [Treponema sp.]